MKGLLFIPEMARKACDEEKTHTRRVIGNFPEGEESLLCIIGTDNKVHYRRPVGHPDIAEAQLTQGYRVVTQAEWWLEECDYQTGERRALLTTWAVAPEFDRLKPTELDPNKVSGHFWHAGMGDKPDGFGKSRPGRFLPNILRAVMMPMFDITDVRIERVQDISELDSQLEGCEIADCSVCGETGNWNDAPCVECGGDGHIYARARFESLWNSINAKRGCGWHKNPVVAVVTFKKL